MWYKPLIAAALADGGQVLVRRIGACIDSFLRKEGLKALDP